jgi:hypothetical protein
MTFWTHPVLGTFWEELERHGKASGAAMLVKHYISERAALLVAEYSPYFKQMYFIPPLVF